MKKKKFFDSDPTIEAVISRLVELGYVCLCDTDFDRRDNVAVKMGRMPVKCLYSHQKKCRGCELYSVDVWDPTEKRFVEMEFQLSGEIVVEKTKITIGKNMYRGEKAVRLVEKSIFGE